MCGNFILTQEKVLWIFSFLGVQLHYTIYQRNWNDEEFAIRYKASWLL